MAETQSPPRNEAAERLLDYVGLIEQPSYGGNSIYDELRTNLLPAALAEERRHVIEQIRDRVEAEPFSVQVRAAIGAILDDLSTPEQDEPPAPLTGLDRHIRRRHPATEGLDPDKVEQVLVSMMLDQDPKDVHASAVMFVSRYRDLSTPEQDR